PVTRGRVALRTAGVFRPASRACRVRWAATHASNSRRLPRRGAADVTRWLCAGPFWLADDGTALHAFEPVSGGRPPLEGALRNAVLSGDRDDRRLLALARLDAQTGALLEALGAGPPHALTRADVLRGTGFSLLFIELTGRCNERCAHCYADAAPE